LIIEGTSISADEFSRRAHLYLLSHYHGDHTRGLRAGWARGPLVAHPATCELLAEITGVPRRNLAPLAPGESMSFDDPGCGAVAITAIEANHCPGAVMFHLAAGGRSMLYTGDFRLDDRVRETARRLAPLDLLYVDSTYARAGAAFPPQEEAVGEIVRIAKENSHREILIAVYTVGKNRVVEAVSRALGRRVYLSPDLLRVYTLLGYGEFVTGDRDATNVRGYRLGYFDRYFKMTRAYREGAAVVIIPTGWAAAIDEGEALVERDGRYRYVAYSEHCDSREREEFLRLVRPRRVIET
jgi:hypothetical protein